MNRLDFNPYILLLFLSSFIISCTHDEKIPLWEITKENAPTSYLTGTINYLKKKDNSELISDKLIQAYDSSSVFITQIDYINSNFQTTNKHIEIDGNKTLKDALNEVNFFELKKLKNQWDSSSNSSFGAPDSTRIKLLFYLQDLINHSDGSNLYLEEFWRKQAMGSQKKTLGLETYSDYFSDLSTVSHSDQIEFLNSIKNLKEFKESLSDSIRYFYKKGEYDKIHSTYLDKFTFYKSNYSTLFSIKHKNWAETIDSTLSTNKCFISLNIKHLFGEENFIKTLLLKGYKINKIK